MGSCGVTFAEKVHSPLHAERAWSSVSSLGVGVCAKQDTVTRDTATGRLAVVIDEAVKRKRLGAVLRTNPHVNA